MWHFNSWLSKRSFTINSIQTQGESFTQRTQKQEFANVQELTSLLDQPFADQKNITRIIKQYLLDEMHSKKTASYMILIKSAIVSYFEKNDYDIRIKFNPKTSHTRETPEQSMSIAELMEFLTTENVLFLCKFHRGLDVATLVDRFNYEAWPQMVDWFKSENHNSWDLAKCPVPIILTRVKTDYKHTGFLDADAIEMLQKYLDYRKKKQEI